MDPNILTDTLNVFLDAFGKGWYNLKPAMNWLIRVFLAIEIVLLGLWWALNGGEQIVNVMKKILFLGFWLWIVTDFPGLADSFVRSLIQAGKLAGGGSAPSLFDPSKIIFYGHKTTLPMINAITSSGWNIANGITFGLLWLSAMLAYFIMAWQIFFTVLEFNLLVGVVGILLPFGFLQQTKFLAEKAIGAVISSGVKLMVLAFIMAVSETILTNLTLPPGIPRLSDALTVVMISGGIAFLAWNAPNVASGLLSGSPSLSANSAASQAGQAVGTAAMVAGTVASAGVAATGAAASAVGGAVKMASAAKTGADIAGGAAAMGGAGPIGTFAASLKGGAEAVGKGIWNRTGGKGADFIKHHAAEGTKEGYVNTGGTMPKRQDGSGGPSWASATIQSLQKARQRRGGSDGGNADNYNGNVL